MRQGLLLVLLALALASGCTRPPYSSPGKDLAAVDNDFTDCYSEASLKVNTPPYPDSPLWAVNGETDTCMHARGYSGRMWFFR